MGHCPRCSNPPWTGPCLDDRDRQRNDVEPRCRCGKGLYFIVAAPGDKAWIGTWHHPDGTPMCRAAAREEKQ